jgi:hypothetical protein
MTFFGGREIHLDLFSGFFPQNESVDNDKNQRTDNPTGEIGHKIRHIAASCRDKILMELVSHSVKRDKRYAYGKNQEFFQFVFKSDIQRIENQKTEYRIFDDVLPFVKEKYIDLRLGRVLYRRNNEN